MTVDFEGDIDFNCLRMISSVSRRYLAKSLLGSFHIAHTHPSGGGGGGGGEVDVPFGGYDLFSPLFNFN